MSENKVSTRLYAADVSALEKEELYRAACRRVTEERLRRVNSLKSKKPRLLSLSVELLLIQGLEREGLQDQDIVYRYGKDGKPYLYERPDIHFNLSHSGDFALCAISSEEIGCDVQKMKKADIKIAKRFFCSSEYEKILAGKTEKEQRELFFRLWTLKESFIKMSGRGMFMPLDSFCFSFGEQGVTVKIKKETTDNVGGEPIKAEPDQKPPKQVYIKEFSEIENYKCALCGTDSCIGEKNGVNLEIIELSELLRN